jgi:hypothetical protein
MSLNVFRWNKLVQHRSCYKPACYQKDRRPYRNHVQRTHDASPSLNRELAYHGEFHLPQLKLTQYLRRKHHPPNSIALPRLSCGLLRFACGRLAHTHKITHKPRLHSLRWMVAPSPSRLAGDARCKRSRVGWRTGAKKTRHGGGGTTELCFAAINRPLPHFSRTFFKILVRASVEFGCRLSGPGMTQRGRWARFAS